MTSFIHLQLSLYPGGSGQSLSQEHCESPPHQPGVVFSVFFSFTNSFPVYRATSENKVALLNEMLNMQAFPLDRLTDRNICLLNLKHWPCSWVFSGEKYTALVSVRWLQHLGVKCRCFYTFWFICLFRIRPKLILLVCLRLVWCSFILHIIKWA